MSDEFTLARDAAKALRAEQLLGDEMLQEAFAGLEASYALAWRSTKIEDVTGREKLFLAINIVGKVRDHLQAIVNNGTLAAAELRQIAETAERERRWQDVRG